MRNVNNLLIDPKVRVHEENEKNEFKEELYHE